MNRNEMDEIYRNIPLEKIPWNIEIPPKALIELTANGMVEPCKTIDLGCGAGNYATYLASIGFDVTGIDISGTAINFAREHSKEKGVEVEFQVADMLGDVSGINETYNFAYDWEVLHHILPEHRNKYVENVHKLLNTKGKYLSVCFSVKDQQFGGSGKYRKTKLGTILYFSSEEELYDLFSPYFNIRELKTIEISGKFAPHLAVYVFMEKNNQA